MPVRSLNSSVIKWPDQTKVIEELQQWSTVTCQNNPDLIGIGYFGSYARGDWGVGSDLDLIVVVKESGLPFEKRSTLLDTTPLPVPVDLMVYTLPEWRQLSTETDFAAAISGQVVWLIEPQIES
jgi:uncharacterized protein